MSNFKIRQQLSNLRNILLPISNNEMRLFIPISVMMICMLFNFGTLRSLKDSLIVPTLGAEVISFLKIWFVLPSTICFTLIYVKLTNILNYEYLFYSILSFFLLYFILFTWLIFPNQHLYHPDPDSINLLAEKYIHFKWFIYLIGKWSYVVMYIFSELWSVVVINLLFWQFANHIFDTQSAKRFYPILGMLGNTGLIIAGNVLTNFTTKAMNVGQIYDIECQCNYVLKPIVMYVTISCVITMLIYRYISHYVLSRSDNNSSDLIPHHSLDDSRTKLSIKDTIKLLCRSDYIWNLTILVLCYGLLINILEGPWKSKIRELYPNLVDYMHFMGQFNIFMGIACVTFMFLGSNILRKFSWTRAALITPYMILATGSIFFLVIIFLTKTKDFSLFANPLYIAIIVGAIQNILSKATKYSLFDSTKEMAYIPLSLELRTKGKAVVEVIGLKLGKSAGAFFQSLIFILMPDMYFDSMYTYLLVIFLIISVLWIGNIKILGVKYEAIKNS